MSDKDQLASVRQYFKVTETLAQWELRCLKCRANYALLKRPSGGEIHPGNILALLNHAYSHK
jgi:hypothetical protein